MVGYGTQASIDWWGNVSSLHFELSLVSQRNERVLRNKRINACLLRSNLIVANGFMFLMRMELIIQCNDSVS